MTKKKLKIKPLVLIIFIILLVIGAIFILRKPSTKNINKSTTQKETTSPRKENKKLKELDYINEKIDYFNNDYLDRYLTYKKANPNLSIENIIINVNIGLDYPYYENVQEAKYQNTSYILVNKYNNLSKDYVPENLEAIDPAYSNGEKYMVSYAKDAFEELAKSAKEEGYNIYAMSTYRSYNYQNSLYNNYVSLDGKENADTYSARAGYSEHQTGLAADVYNKEKSYTEFEQTKEFTWMQENAYKFGFILRYPKDKVQETGYMYESWHYRYVGKEIADYIHKHNITYEEYFVKFIEGKK